MIEQRAIGQASITTVLGQRMARWGHGWARFVRTQPLGTFGLAICIFMLVVGVIGPRGKNYVPFVGTLFVYIFTQNWMGLIPGLKSPTSSVNTTAGLAVSVFFYVQWVGLRENGLKNYILHLMGSPKDVVGWAMVPLNLPLHILEEFIRPLSLALRLFGNVLGEDALIGVFAGLGILAVSVFHSPVGLPLQLPFMMLAMLTGTIQALVFSLLSTIYISLMLPHEEHDAHAHEKVVS